MHLSTGGYSRRQYDSNLLRQTAQKLAAELPGIMQSTGADTVAVTGKSGLSLAFATLMLIDFPLMVVRKAGEMSHGHPIEGRSAHKVQRYLVLDDFVASGQTVRNIVKRVGDVAYTHAESAPTCVGVVVYGESDSKTVQLHDENRDVRTFPCYTPGDD